MPTDAFLSKEQLFNKTSELDDTVRSLQPLDARKFIRLKGRYVYSEPLRNKDDEVITNLDFPEQLYVLEQFGKREGLKLRHGMLEENVAASRNKRAVSYIGRVLRPYSIYANEVLLINNYIAQAEGVRFTSHPPHYGILIKGSLIFDSDAYVERILVGKKNVLSKFEVKRLQKQLEKSWEKDLTDYRRLVKDIAIPKVILPITKRDVVEWVWGGVISKDEKGFSAIWHSWDDRDDYFGVIAESPTTTYSKLAVPIWTDQNPRI